MTKLISIFSYCQIFVSGFSPYYKKCSDNEDKILLGKIEKYREWGQPA